MEKNKFAIFVCSFLILLNIFLGIKIKKHENEYANNLQIIENRRISDSLEIKKLESFIEVYYYLNFNELSEKLRQKFPYWKGEKHVVVYYLNGQCKSCLAKILMDCSLLKDETHFNNFVVMGEYKDSILFYKEFSNMDNDFQRLISPFSICESAKIELPIVFAIDGDFKIEMLYSPDLITTLRHDFFYNKLKDYIMKTQH